MDRLAPALSADHPIRQPGDDTTAGAGAPGSHDHQNGRGREPRSDPDPPGPADSEPDGDAAVFVASFARILLAAALLIPMMLLARREYSGWERAVPRIPTADWARLAAIAVAGMFLFSVFMLYGMQEVSGAVGRLRWAALAWWGLGTMAIGSALWYAGVAKAPGITASAFVGVMPVSAILLSYLLLGEAFEWIHLIGMIAVLLGIAAVVEGERRREQRQRS